MGAGFEVVADPHLARQEVEVGVDVDAHLDWWRPQCDLIALRSGRV